MHEDAELKGYINALQHNPSIFLILQSNNAFTFLGAYNNISQSQFGNIH